MTAKAEYQRAYRLANRERLRAQQAAYRATHKAEAAEYNRAYYAAAADARRAYSRRYHSEHRETIAARRQDPAYLARHRAYKVSERARHPGRIAARNAVTHALERGELVRGPCAECGVEPTQAHHHNGYERAYWFDVTWLCPAHHGEAHRETLDAPI